MASVAALNVRIGGDIKQLEKALKDAERAVKKSGAQLSAIGNDLSLKLSLPMAAFGAASLKAAGDIEALNKSMIAIFAGSGRSVEEARMEVDALRKSAEAPGLDFEQAVKASIRLQGVGQSAEKARNTVEQLANAVATTGGTAEDLGEVVNQFSQMIGKGKILNEDIKIITGRMPILAGLMKDAFGSTQAEDIRATGVTASEFVDILVKGMGKMTRVEGGISNAIVNAGTSIKMFLASVGESLNKTFNITGKLESFAKWLDGMGKAFAGMSDGTRTAVAGVAVFVLALGPMIKVGQFAILAYGQLVAVFGALQKVLLQSLAGQAIPGAIAGFKALEAATRLTIVGAAIGVVLALAAAYVTLRKDTSDAAKAQEQLGIVEVMASNSVAEQMTRVNILTGTLKSNVASLDAKKRALNELNTIAPEYFGKVKLGADVVAQATTAQNAYRESLMKTARVQAATEQLMGLEKQLNELAQGSSASTMQTLVNVLKSGGSATQFFSEQAQTLGDNFQKSKTTIEAQKKVLLDLIIANQGVVVSAKNVGGGLDENGDKTKNAAKAWEEYMVAVHKADLAQKEIQGTLEYQDIRSQNKPVDQIAGIKTPEASDPGFAEKFESGMERVKTAAASAGASIQGVTGTMQEGLQRWADSLNEKIGDLPNKISDAIGAISGLADAITDRNIENLNKEMEARLIGVKAGSAQELKIKEEFAAKMDAINRRAAKRAKVLAVIMAAMQGAQAVLKGLATGGPPGALLAGAIAAVQIATIIATPLAQGGIVSGPTHALVGEYPGARNNPEVVAPLNKLKGMLRESGGDVNVYGTFRVQGPDLLLVLEKAQRQRGRANGS